MVKDSLTLQQTKWEGSRKRSFQRQLVLAQKFIYIVTYRTGRFQKKWFSKTGGSSSEVHLHHKIQMGKVTKCSFQRRLVLVQFHLHGNIQKGNVPEKVVLNEGWSLTWGSFTCQHEETGFRKKWSSKRNGLSPGIPLLSLRHHTLN